MLFSPIKSHAKTEFITSNLVRCLLGGVWCSYMRPSNAQAPWNRGPRVASLKSGCLQQRHFTCVPCGRRQRWRATNELAQPTNQPKTQGAKELEAVTPQPNELHWRMAWHMHTEQAHRNDSGIFSHNRNLPGNIVRFWSGKTSSLEISTDLPATRHYMRDRAVHLGRVGHFSSRCDGTISL